MNQRLGVRRSPRNPQSRGCRPGRRQPDRHLGVPFTTHVLQVDPGEEVIEKLRDLVKLSPVTRGSMTLIGAVHECTVSVMRKDDPQDDLLRSYDQPFELTGTGEVVNGEIHVHVTLAGEDLIAAGHLHRAVVRDFFVRAYLTDLDR